MTFNLLIAFGQDSMKRVKAHDQRLILFVCEHGAGRSAIAASYFNKSTERQGLPFHAIFRGVEPQEALGASTKNGLTKDSVDITPLVPTKLSNKDIEDAYMVITLDCTLPGNFKRPNKEWTGIPMNGDYEASKAKIKAQVDSLISMISKGKKKY